MSDNANDSVDVPRDADGKIIVDPNDYNLDEEELAFLKSQTGITDEEVLKEHCIEVQAAAHKIYPYNCIRRFKFLRLKIASLPAYPHLLKLGEERKGAIFLDIGCCFGNDVRKTVADGYPVENVIASDLQAEFWQLGHQLFRSTPKTFPVPFLAGDAFDQNFLKRVPPFYTAPETPAPDLQVTGSLTPLLGYVSAIHASAFFHLFCEEQQFQLAQALAGLLSPKSGSIIFGAHVGRQESGFLIDGGIRRGSNMFCHSPESWAELWDGRIFKKGTVKVEAMLEENARPAKASLTTFRLCWSVTRL
ncbi:hypothetical protein OBBRIDRAFT_737703 [Obba rivulosa]|uniref:Methyltransferase ausD n=1 Tax=Obba rivulosa TaxID=1052685 RepID=A0A8E2DL80_9APHY|nr:hypothetical protein OBBRIDRAFT_737703 [Obba rivulosa]